MGIIWHGFPSFHQCVCVVCVRVHAHSVTQLWLTLWDHRPPGSSVEFSRREYWSGCVCACLVAQLCLTLCDPMDCSPPVHGDSPGKNTGELLCSPPGDLSNSGIEPRSSALQADSLPAELPGNPKCIFVLCFQRALQSTEFLRENKASHTHKTDILTVCVLRHNWLYHCN